MRTSPSFSALGGALLLGALSASAGPVDLSKLPPAAAQQGVTYEKDIKPFLDASCIRCHGQERPKAGLRLDTLEGILKGGKEGKVVAERNGTKSLIVLAASQLDPEVAMPPKPRPGKRGPGQGPGQGPGPGGPPPAAQGAQRGPGGAPNLPPGPPPKPLTTEQVGLLRAWIDQGAK